MAEWSVGSPGGATEIAMRLDGGRLAYDVAAFGTAVVDGGALGLRRDDADLATGLELVDAGRVEAVDEPYEVLHGKQRCGRLQANRRLLGFDNARGDRIDVVLLAADDGVAFRYVMPGDGIATVTQEATSFAIAGDGRAWIQPTQAVGYAAPAYENLYANGVPIGHETEAPSWNFPALFELDGAWLLLAESDLDAGYFGGHLDNRGTGRTYRITLPQPAEGGGVGAVEPTSDLPWSLPWRVLILGQSASAVAESALVTALARPPAGDFTWVRPGRVSWSWWSEHTSPMQLDRLRDHVDLAAELGWEHTLVDANWTVHSDADIHAFVDYARLRHVGVFLWYNSGGPHNGVTERPRDRMHDPAVRAAEMDKLAGWGVAGVKVDFFHSDKQAGIDLYLGIARDAAARGLMVNFHGSTVPRGWDRTWPNVMTMEGVRGAEQYAFDAAYPQAAPWHNTILPFTRNVVGSMDYTPVTFGDQAYPHLTTDAHELALAVVFESGLQHFADSAASYRGQPAEIREFLAGVPAVWDETRFLAGRPGEYVVVARRHGDGWWVGGINGGDEARTVDLELPRGDAALVITDAGTRRELPAQLTMAPMGGFAARLGN